MLPSERKISWPSNSKQRRLDLLEAFRAEVWGNPSIFVVKSESPHQAGRTVEYLDLGKHLRAVQFFCCALMQKELLVIQEYRNAMDRFKSDDPDYKNGACIIGQPGIAMTYCITRRKISNYDPQESRSLSCTLSLNSFARGSQ
jgi:hypothetical protein